jgi:hypothetical protein
MAWRIWTAGLVVALAAGVTGCERHSWNQVSEFYKGHHSDHGDHAAKEGGAHGTGGGKEAAHAPQEAGHGAKEQPKPH